VVPFGEMRPLTCFAGIWTQWASIPEKEGGVTADLHGFLTMEPNAEVGAIHPEAKPIILRTLERIDFGRWAMGSGICAAVRWHAQHGG
jgi:putative SOS response-associated peptidase YedK